MELMDSVARPMYKGLNRSMKSVLFVCLANICRSPAAEGVFRQMIAQDPALQDIHVESCGLGDWYVGHLPDERMRAAAKERGIILMSRAQSFQPHFFQHFDYILGVDYEVTHILHKYAKEPTEKAKIHLITAFSATFKNEEIPDPFHQGDAAFELVLDMIEDSCQGLIEHLKSIE
jgi:protein-tyrosine phosphatase